MVRDIDVEWVERYYGYKGVGMVLMGEGVCGS